MRKSKTTGGINVFAFNPKHGHHHGHGRGRHGCGGHHGFVRRHYSRQEQLEELKAYKDALEKELAGVTERIADLEE